MIDFVKEKEIITTIYEFLLGELEDGKCSGAVDFEDVKASMQKLALVSVDSIERIKRHQILAESKRR
jgi:hypothetical protein|tara:strand:- start:148 stop:348 length:201 start_codon:yes stop_codon:yes gene_type:complete